MFTSRLVTLAFVLVFAIVNVMAAPLPLQMRVGLAGAGPRDLAPFTPIRAYMKRDGMWESDYGRRTDGIPEQEASKSDASLQVVAFPRSSDYERRIDGIPEQEASKSDASLQVVAFRRAPQNDDSFAMENAV